MVCVLLVAGVALVYVQTYRHDFVNIDDDNYVTKNPQLAGGLTAEAVAWAFTTNRTSSWHPLTWISLLLDSQLFGTSSAGGYHLTNLLLHAANAVLLFLLMLRLTRQLWASAMVAALFAVHPARVESVAWVTERKDVLSGLFGLLTLWAYVWYTRAPNIVRYFLVVLALALGLMAKSTLVTLPLVLLLLDYWPLRRPLGWRLLLEKAPLFIAAAGCAAVMFLMQRAGGAVVSLGSVSTPARFLRAALLYWSYLRISVWPVNLSLYPIPEPGNCWRALAAGGVLALLTAGTIWAARRTRKAPQPWLPVGWFWFLGTLAPTIGLVQVGSQVLADRFLYLPQIGLWIAVVWGAAELLRQRNDRKDNREINNCDNKTVSLLSLSYLLPLSAALVLTVFTTAAWRQTARWQNSVTLWTHALACDERDSTAHLFMGLALNAQHRDDLAEAHFRAALRADPDSRTAYCALGWLLEQKGNLDEAARCYADAIDRFGDMPEAEYSLGNILWKKGDLRGAESHLAKAIALRADFAQARVSLAQLREQQGADNEVVELCRAALEIDPGLADAHVLLANSAARHGNAAGAAEHLRIAVQINPHLPDEYLGLADACAEAGRFSDAVRAATTAHHLAAAAGQLDLVADIQRRLDLFRAGKAFHRGK